MVSVAENKSINSLINSMSQVKIDKPIQLNKVAAPKKNSSCKSNELELKYSLTRAGLESYRRTFLNKALLEDFRNYCEKLVQLHLHNHISEKTYDREMDYVQKRITSLRCVETVVFTE